MSQNMSHISQPLSQVRPCMRDMPRGFYLLALGPVCLATPTHQPIERWQERQGRLSRFFAKGVRAELKQLDDNHLDLFLLPGKAG